MCPGKRKYGYVLGAALLICLAWLGIGVGRFLYSFSGRGSILTFEKSFGIRLELAFCFKQPDNV